MASNSFPDDGREPEGQSNSAKAEQISPSPFMGNLTFPAYVLVLVVGSIILDQGSKWMALTYLSTPPYMIEVTPFFNLRLGFNTGVSFGMFSDLFGNQQIVLVVVSAFIALGLFAWALYTNMIVEKIALSLITGGAIGNIIDRLRQGAVTDFLDFHLMDYHWPTFNLADVFVVSGAALLVAVSFLNKSPNQGANHAQNDET